MLNYHIIHSQPCVTTTCEYNHFLSLGSFESSINLDPLLSFSTINLFKGTKIHINQQKKEQGTFNVVLNLGKKIRVDGAVLEGGELFGGASCVDENGVQEGEQQITTNAQILYIVVRGNQAFQNGKIPEHLSLTSSLSLTHKMLKKDEQLHVNKRIFLFIRSGKIKIQETGQQVPQGECLYTRKGCGKIKASENAQLFVLEFSSQK